MAEMNALETQAQESLARVQQLTRGERQDRFLSVTSAFITLLSVAPVNAALAFVPVLFLAPVIGFLFLLPFFVIGISMSLLLQASTHSSALNWSLVGLVCAGLFLSLLLYDLGRACLLALAWWLQFHFRFLLGDS